MVRTVVIMHVYDGELIYIKGDRVRIKMKPSDENHPERANEYIGEIVHIAEGSIFLDIGIDTRLLDVNNIDKMRFAQPDETFDNIWNF